MQLPANYRPKPKKPDLRVGDVLKFGYRSQYFVLKEDVFWDELFHDWTVKASDGKKYAASLFDRVESERLEEVLKSTKEKLKELKDLEWGLELCLAAAREQERNNPRPTQLEMMEELKNVVR